MKRGGFAAALAVGGMLLSVQPAIAYQILAPGSTVAGKSIADWTADWWTWAAQSPGGEVPYSDPDGGWANRDNDRPVFFVAGTGGGPEVTRSFNVPLGRPLLIPMINTGWIGWFPPDTEADVEAALSGLDWENTVTGLYAEIDGQAVPNPETYLEESDFFSAGTAVAGTVVTSEPYPFGGPPPVGADLYPSKAIGHWIVVEGLGIGAHTLRFGGVRGEFETATVAQINIVPEPLSLLLLLPGLAALLVAGRRTSKET